MCSELYIHQKTICTNNLMPHTSETTGSVNVIMS